MGGSYTLATCFLTYYVHNEPSGKYKRDPQGSNCPPLMGRLSRGTPMITEGHMMKLFST